MSMVKPWFLLDTRTYTVQKIT